MSFKSHLKKVGQVKLPQPTGIRVMMMPFHLHDPDGSLPDYIRPWSDVLNVMCAGDEGIGYLTIDEAIIPDGETHRRPGMHVDGVGPKGDLSGGWGGGGGYAGTYGMKMVSSHVGCRAWEQTFLGMPGPDGDCSHLASQIDPRTEVIMGPGEVWHCAALCVHEALPMDGMTYRQFCRISMPSGSPWYEGYSANPLGIQPTGPIHTARMKQMSYRP